MPDSARPWPVSAAAPAAGLWRGRLGVAACVFLACLIGIYSRPIGYLSAFWPANAVLLGLLLRHPRWAASAGIWLCAMLAFVAADLATGAPWQKALGINAGNLAGVFAGWLYLSRLPEAVLYLRHQRSVLHLVAGSAVAALGCGLVGGYAGSHFLGIPLLQSVAMWTFSEFFNFILLIPVFLAAPKGWVGQWRLQEVMPALRGRPLSPSFALPLAALVASEALTLVIGGPGALGFVMPALVWCAMAYGVLPTAVINLLLYGWKTASVALGTFSFTHTHLPDVISLRVGMALLSVAPLAVACAYALRLQALEKLDHAVNHDFLTGVLTRRALLERGTKLLERMQGARAPLSLLMLDLDHFKRINDRYGHAQGDVVLRQLVHQVRQFLRPDDILGRLGGEEFAVLLPRTSCEQARSIGERLCRQLGAHPVALGDGTQLTVTCSIGLHGSDRPQLGETLSHWLSCADRALYQAKASGRNQVQSYSDDLAPMSTMEAPE